MKCGIGVLCVMVVLVALTDARPSPYKARKRRAYSQVNRGRSQKNATTINEKDRLGNSVIGVDASSENMSQTLLDVKQDGLELTGVSSKGESQKATAVKIKSADGREALVASQVNASASRDSLVATRTGPDGYMRQVKADKGNTAVSRANVAHYTDKNTGADTRTSNSLKENESHDVKSVVDNRGNSKETSKHSKTSQSQSEVHSNGNIDFGYLGIGGGGGDTPHAGPAPSNTGRFRNPQRPSDGAGPSAAGQYPSGGRPSPDAGSSPGGRQYADAGPYAGAGSSAGAQPPPRGRPGGVPSPDAGESPPGPYGHDSPHGDSRRTYAGAHQPPAEHQPSAAHPPPAAQQPSGAQQPTGTKPHPGTKSSTGGGTFKDMWNNAIGGGKSGVHRMKQWSHGHLASHPFPSFHRKRAARRFRRAIRRLSES